MRHADFVSIREGQRKTHISLFFADGIYFRAGVAAGFFGVEQKFIIEIIITHNLLSGLPQIRNSFL